MSKNKVIVVSFDDEEKLQSSFNVNDGKDAYEHYTDVEGNENETLTDFIKYLKGKDSNNNAESKVSINVDAGKALSHFRLDDDCIELSFIEDEDGFQYYTGGKTVNATKPDNSAFTKDDIAKITNSMNPYYGYLDITVKDVTKYPEDDSEVKKLTLKINCDGAFSSKSYLVSKTLDKDGMGMFFAPIGVVEDSDLFNFVINFKFKPYFTYKSGLETSSCQYGNSLRWKEVVVTDVNNNKDINISQVGTISEFNNDKKWKLINKPFIQITDGDFICVITSGLFDKTFNTEGFWNNISLPVCFDIFSEDTGDFELLFVGFDMTIGYGSEYDYELLSQSIDTDALTGPNFLTFSTSKIKVTDFNNKPVSGVLVRSLKFNGDKYKLSAPLTDESGETTVTRNDPLYYRLNGLFEPGKLVSATEDLFIGKVLRQLTYQFKSNFGVTSFKVVSKDDDNKTCVVRLTLSSDSAIKDSLGEYKAIINDTEIPSFNEEVELTVENYNKDVLSVVIEHSDEQNYLTDLDLNKFTE